MTSDYRAPEERTRHPTVSIVLVTYNRPSGLADTLRDLLGQSYRDFEIVICDDASSDSETPLICLDAAARDPRVRYLRQKVNIGMPHNLNSGIDIARGRYVAITHDGDRYHRDLIKCWLEALIRCKDALLVFNEYAHLSQDGSIHHISGENLQECNNGITIVREYYRRWHFDSPIWGTVMAPREALIEEGLFDSQYGFYADIDMWLRLSEQGHVAYVERPLIGLASRTTWPRHFHMRQVQQRRIVRQIFFRSRLRVTRKHPFLLVFEMFRHGLFCFADSSFIFLLAVRRWLRKRSSQPGSTA